MKTQNLTASEPKILMSKGLTLRPICWIGLLSLSLSLTACENPSHFFRSKQSAQAAQSYRPVLPLGDEQPVVAAQAPVQIHTANASLLALNSAFSSTTEKLTAIFNSFSSLIHPSVSKSSAFTPETSPEIGWREFFRDPQLQKLIEIGLLNNHDLRIALQRIQEARAQWGIQEGERWPAIGAGLTGQRQHLPKKLNSDPNASSITSQYQAGLGLTAFEIDLFGRLKNLSKAAFQQYLASEQSYRSAHITLVSEIANAYFNLRAANTQLATVNQTWSARNKVYELVKQRFEGGVASELELNQAQASLETAAADLAQSKRSAAESQNALSFLIGTPLPIDLPEPAAFDQAQVIAAVPIGLPSHLLIRRPDIMAAEHQLQSANANIEAARAAFFPTISLTGLLGWASPALGALFSHGTQGYWSFSPSITLPLFAGGRLRSAVDQAQARSHIAVVQYEQSIYQAFKEVADALAGEATFDAQLKAQRALEKSSARALELSQFRYQAGVDSFLQVQTAQLNFYSAQTGRIQTELAALVNRVKLYKSLGGGWEETLTPQL